MVLSYEEIKEIISQRFPFLMVDKVVELDKGKSITSIKNVTGNEIQFLGHFPDQAIMPGVLIVEAAAQTAAILLLKSYEFDEAKKKQLYFGSINKMRFLRPVIPGDQLVIKVKAVKLISYAGIVTAEIFVDETLAVSGELTFSMPNRGNSK